MLPKLTNDTNKKNNVYYGICINNYDSEVMNIEILCFYYSFQ